MSSIPKNLQTSRDVSDETNKTLSALRAWLRKLTRSFWTYSKGTSKTDTKPYDGLL